MKIQIKTIITTFFIAALAVGAYAKTTKAQSRHERAHQEQLANQNRLDKTALNDVLRSEIEQREIATNLTPESSRLIDDMLSEAKRYIGRPYILGAKGPTAFDCSGYTSYIYRQFGYSIAPSSRDQYTQGKPVDRKDLRKGDLVFFTSRSSGGKVGHVGIVWSVEDNGHFKFIHASVKGVRISDFEGYYVGRYVGAKRIIEN
jgi:cell wall-associated NlpC family hydrolase